VTALLASIIASLVAWLFDLVLSGHVAETTQYIVSFVVGSVVFVPSYIWIKRMKDNL
jgi:ABC-type thiamin/hydroxymethylpyrimidine transport system permease subunit